MTQPTLVPQHATPPAQDEPPWQYRADHLCWLASRIEGSIVMGLGRTAGSTVWPSPRRELGDRLLERNQQQLHQAADRLRALAYELRRNGSLGDAA